MKRLVAIVTCISLSGCVVAPVIDQETSKSVTGKSYDADLADCRALAAQDHQVNTAASIGIGAVLGAIIGAAIGGDRHSMQVGAGTGAASMGMAGLGESLKSERESLNKCLTNRGYTVLR